MGADVIKVEPPDGDLLRVSGGSMGRDKGMGPIYMAANRNKRSLCLDLKKPAAVAVLKDLVRDADLFIHNSRPAAIERLGLGYEDLKKVNPSIIYAYSLGYARKGPYGHKPAFDDLVQGVSGAASLQSRVDGQAPRFMPSLIADKTTGLHLCIAVLGALYHRKCTGEGQMIEGADARDAGVVLADRASVRRDLAARPRRDGLRPHHQQVSPSVPHQERLCLRAALYRPALEDVLRDRRATRPRRGSALCRSERAAQALQRALPGARFAAEAPHHRGVAGGLRQGRHPAMPVRTLEELLEDPHLKATGFFTEREHPTEGPITTFASPLDFEKTKVEYRHHAPRIGEDGEAILREAGAERDGHRKAQG